MRENVLKFFTTGLQISFYKPIFMDTYLELYCLKVYVTISCICNIFKS